MRTARGLGLMRSLAKSVRGRGRWVDAVLVRTTVRTVLSGAEWEIQTLERARSGTWIARVQSDAGQEAVLKLADSRSGTQGLERERQTLQKLALDGRLDGLRPLVPAVLDTGRSGRWTYLLLQRLRGIPATGLMAADPESVVAQASILATRLHAATATPAIVGADEIHEWVIRPVQSARWLLGNRISADESGALETIAVDHSALLNGATVRLGWVHGDLWSDNVLVDPTDSTITGLVDWDSATDRGIAAHDQLHLVLYSRKLANRTEIGTEIVRALGHEPRWQPAEADALHAGTDGLPGSEAAARLRLGIMLYWLRFVVGNLDRQPRATRQRRWIAENISSVLACR